MMGTARDEREWMIKKERDDSEGKRY